MAPMPGGMVRNSAVVGAVAEILFHLGAIFGIARRFGCGKFRARHCQTFCNGPLSTPAGRAVVLSADFDGVHAKSSVERGADLLGIKEC